ncbi:PilZ domain-containing protein [Methylobacterium sp. NEAU K]|uniref:PilZ domain-containing protein n=1 Tax=Methylobacterium sp. NEAU K TaxID=3064946 RepID=UPI0027339AA1|nr:PilZ domain-containing protein [Methylobacterium sp. NEAU K]MDP4004010.1 PilZ domain-containing protein [Methylobacterium sp. NEAU K]
MPSGLDGGCRDDRQQGGQEIVIERRHTARRRVCLGGHVRVAAFLPEIDCIVRDVSLGGAKIRVPSTATLPDCFDLFIPCRSETRRAWVAWRDGDVFGIGFDVTTAASEPEAVARRLADSEAEVARLRAALMAGNGPEPACVH